uniref:Ig-like domain-containing protein n=1 Tax=Neogobius melanostomus TaxID=47308 RepID=A0A8C6WHJ8_9GOBI
IMRERGGLIIKLLCCMNDYHSMDLDVNSVNAAVGGSVTFTTSLTPTGTPLDSITWNRDTRLIVNSVAGGVSITPEYKDRVTLDVLTGSLELRNLAVSDNGKYDVTIIPTAGDESITGQATLKFNDTVRLSCSASGSSLSFLWFNDSVEVTASDRVRITESVESATLTIVTVLRYDQGLYTCNVSNPVSSSNSSDEDVTLTISPSAEYYGEGSVVSFSCSADSRPEAQFRWFINGDMLSSTEAQINLVMEQSGNYSCQAFNSKTLRYTTSPSAEIFVLSKNTSGCVNFMPFYTIVLTLSSCKTVKMPLMVHYFSDGPDSVQISGPMEVQEGSTLKLSCSAESVPTAKYTWTKNGTTLVQSHEYTKDNIISSDSGEYICGATNDITTKSSKASRIVDVTAGKLLHTFMHM